MQTPNSPEAELLLTDDALICGFQIPSSGETRELRASEIGAALAEPGAVTWLHFRLANARTEQFLAKSTLAPELLRERIQRRDGRSCVEPSEQGLVVILSDLSFDHTADPGETAEIWAFATAPYLVTARMHALQSSNALRLALRQGLRVESGVELLAALLGLRSEALRRDMDQLAVEVDEIEDEILRGDIKQQRERLGRVRRRCARIRRHFIPDRAALQKTLVRPPDSLDAANLERFRSTAEELGYLIDEANELYERAKLLQEELASRLAEKTGDRLYALSVLSAIMLPMTLVTGVFGMNVAGLPGLEGEGSFTLTMLLIFAAGGLTLWLMHRRELL